MSLHTCSDITEAVVLEGSLGLYLKPVSKIKINVQLPKLRDPGQSISSWNVMEKLKATVRPDQFLNLKSLKITANVIKFEGELETKASSERALARLRATGSLKLGGFTEKLQLRAAHAPCSGPTRHEWEAFYRDAKGVNEMKPGERPDTIHLQDVPVRWFASSSKPTKPSEKVLRKAFATFGRIRRLEIPSNESTLSESTFGKKSSLHNDLLFEAYIQYEEYVEFSIAMDSLRGKKLIYKDTDGKVYSADIKVDFDRTNYLSDRCINKRVAETKKVNLASSTESANTVKHDSQIPRTSTSTVIPDGNVILKIKEEKEEKFPTKERKVSTNEAKLLLKELLTRAEKSIKSKEKLSTTHHKSAESNKRKKSEDSRKTVKKEKLLQTKEKNKEALINLELEKKRKEKLIEQERLLKAKLLQKMRLRELEKVAHNREKLRKELAGRNALKSVLAVKKIS